MKLLVIFAAVMMITTLGCKKNQSGSETQSAQPDNGTAAVANCNADSRQVCEMRSGCIWNGLADSCTTKAGFCNAQSLTTCQNYSSMCVWDEAAAACRLKTEGGHASAPDGGTAVANCNADSRQVCEMRSGCVWNGEADSCTTKAGFCNAQSATTCQNFSAMCVWDGVAAACKSR